MKTIFKLLPSSARQSIALDKGMEFTDRQRLNESFGMKTYFCDTYASWQKDGVENANGIIRRHIQKASKADDYSAQDVQAISSPHQLLHLVNP